MYRGESPPAHRAVAAGLLLVTVLFMYSSLEPFDYRWGVIGWPYYVVAGLLSQYPVTCFMFATLVIASYYVRLGPGSKEDRTQLMLSF